MKDKQKVDLYVAISLILVGVALLVLPLFDVTNIKWIFFGIMIVYAIANFIKYILTRKEKDFEGILTMILCLIIGLSGLIFNLYDEPKKIALSLLIWVGLMSLIKLKKADYYHDRKNSIWKLRVGLLILFMVIGLLTSINLFYSENIQSLILGFFFFIHGTLELMDPCSQYFLGAKK